MIERFKCLEKKNPDPDMTLYFKKGSPDTIIPDDELKSIFKSVLTKLGDRSKVMLIPPDYTRYHSNAGILSQAAYEHYGKGVKDVMPALGTHVPVSEDQRKKMFGKIPSSLFRVHDWRNDVMTIGHVSGDLVKAASNGRLSDPWPAQLNKLVWKGGHDLILSLGQVVPHEVLGMANHSKNLFVGVGGADAINFSHFIGAVYGMEKMMGVADNPLRRIFNTAAKQFLKDLPVVYALTVVGRDEKSGQLVTRGLFIGSGEKCFYEAAKLSMEVNFTMLERPIKKCVVYLDPEEYHTTWLGNKSIYRTRMAIEDGGELIVLAPGVNRFGEDDRIDELIRKYGYRTTPEILDLLEKNTDMMKNLSAVAHLIHGSTENRFSVKWCAAGLTRKEVEGVGYEYERYTTMSKIYDVKKLKEGWNTTESGEEIFFIRNPAVGLWATRDRFSSPSTTTKKKRKSEVTTNDEKNTTSIKQRKVDS